jgi:hypothetical protein
MDMNGMLGPTPIPSGLTEFVLPGGARFALDLVEANREMMRILKAHEQAPEAGQELDAWQAWVKTKTGIDMNLGQVDWLWMYIVQERERARADFTRELQLLNSTASTPAGSAPAP